MTENINRLLINYSNARKSWESWCYLNNIDLKSPNENIRTYVDNNDLLFHLRYLAHKDFHIEFYKIFKDNDSNKDNIFKLLRQLPRFHPNKEKVETNLKDLNGHSDTIKRVLAIRDKYYAHLDPNFEDYLKENNSIENLHQCFYFIEQSIMTLTSQEYLMTHLDKIFSRDELSLNIN